MELTKQEMKMSGFLSQEKGLKYLFDNKKLEQFISEVEKLRNTGKKVSPAAVQISQHFQSILEKNERALKILRGSRAGWKTNKIDQKTQLSVKVTGTNVQLCYEGLLTASLENICVMIYQVNNFNQWVPFCTKGEDLNEVSPLEKICYLQFKIPFLTERYAYFYALGIDRIDQNGTIVIYGEGISENEELMKKYNIRPDKDKIGKMVLMDIKFFICEISYRSQSEFCFKSYCEMDSRMPILPEWLVNTVIKQMGGFIFDRIIKQSRNFQGSVWEKQKLADSTNQFYPWLAKRIQAWHHMHPTHSKI